MNRYKRFHTLLTVSLFTVMIMCGCIAQEKSLFQASSTSASLSQPQTIDIPVINQSTPSSITLECFTEGKKGYMDITGSLVIPICFDDVEPFSEGVARVEIDPDPDAGGDSQWGYINSKGEFVIPPEIKSEQFLSLTRNSFSDGLLPLKKEPEGKIGYINTVGEFVIEPQFTTARSFHEGMAGVCLAKEKCGYINTAGKIVIEPKFKYVRSFHQGVAVVALPGPGDLEARSISELIDHLYGLIDRSGTLLVPPEIHKVYLLENFPSNDNGHLGYFDTPFSKEGLLPVRISYSEAELAELPDNARPDGIEGTLGYGKWGYVSRTGGYAIEPRYVSVGLFEVGYGLFEDGYAVVEIADNDTQYPENFRGKDVVIDRNGNILSEWGDLDNQHFQRYLNSKPERRFLFSEEIKLESDFEYGLAVASYKPKGRFDKPKLGYANTQGTFVIEPQFDSARPFRANGLAVVGLNIEGKDDQLKGLIDRSGAYLIEPQSKGIITYKSGLITIIPGEGSSKVDLVMPGSTKKGLPYYPLSDVDSEGLIMVTTGR